MQNIILIFFGAGLGGVLRYSVGLYAARLTNLPFGTLSVNIIGSLLMGFIIGVLLHKPNETVRLLLTTGLMGGFTTFSAFSYEVISLYTQGQGGQAFVYMLASLIFSFLACALGLWIGGRLV
jgi:fluoride exporter